MTAPPTGSSAPSDIWLDQFAEDADGFTVFPLDTSYPIVGPMPGDCATFALAIAALQASKGKCHTIGLRRGCTYTAAQFSAALPPGFGGSSPQTPLVITAVGSPTQPRPIVQGQLTIGPKGPNSYIVFAGLDFYDPTADPTSAPSLYAHKASAYEAGIRAVVAEPGSKYWWFEDCRFRCLRGGLELQDTSGAYTDTVIVRRCTIDHNYFNRWGLYANQIQDLLITQCTLDHNGWSDDAAVCRKTGAGMSHNAYLQESAVALGTRTIGNIVARPAAEGIEQRSGGQMVGNSFIGCPIAGFVAKFADATITDNTVMGAGFDLSLAPGFPRGDGLFSDNTPVAAMSNNMCLDKKDAVNNGAAFKIQSDSTDGSPDAHTVMTGSGLIALPTWTGPAFTWSGEPGVFTISGMLPDVWTGAPGVIVQQTYSYDGRTLQTYCESLGRPDITDPISFLAAACLNRKGNYDARLTAAALNAYLFAGVALISVKATPSTPSTPAIPVATAAPVSGAPAGSAILGNLKSLLSANPPETAEALAVAKAAIVSGTAVGQMALIQGYLAAGQTAAALTLIEALLA